MKTLNEQEYLDYYNKNGKCIDESMPRKNPYTERQVLTRFKTYIKRIEKKREQPKKPVKKIQPKRDLKWEEVRAEVYKRDKEFCQLYWRLSTDELMVLQSNAAHLYGIVDPAHVFGKGAFPHMKYDLDNIVCLNRFSHSMLDSGKHPLTGKMITKKECEEWWERIIGKELYSILEERSKRKING